MRKQHLVIIVLATITFTSCVSKKTYQAALSDIEQLRKDSAYFNQKADDLDMALTRYTDSLNEFRQRHNQEISALLAQLDEKSELISEKEGVLADRANRLREMQTKLFSQNERMDDLRRSMRKALVDVPAKDLELEMRNGKLYINLSENLLFASGSAIIDVKGREALKSVADVLNNSPDLQIEIIGHTDSIPIRTARFSDNWDLSAARATSITRVLVNDYDINGERIKASGRSEHKPIASNAKPEGRAQNRRTEIVISPKLELLYQLLDD